jgi:hypothetical protein
LAPARARPAEVPVTKIRSTLILSSLQTIRARNLFDDYVDQLSTRSPNHRDAVLNCVAGVWLPIDVALAHYWAYNALRLPLSEEIKTGRDVGERIQGSFLGMITRTAKSAGATPWTILEQLERLWDRVYFGGGGVGVVKLGPKEARVELFGLPLLQVPYFRHAYRGAFHAGLELLCNRVYVTETRIATPNIEMCMAVRVSWA